MSDKVATQIPNDSNSKDLFHVDPPIEEHEYVISSVGGLVSVETYLFPSNESGEIVDWMELKGSQRGVADTTKPLRDLGYEIRFDL